MIVADDRQLDNQNQTQIKLVGETSFVGQLGQNLTAFLQENHAFYPECLPNLTDENKVKTTESCFQFSHDFANPKSNTIVARNFNDDVITKNSRSSAGVDGKLITKRFL